MAGLDHSKQNGRDRIVRQGEDSILDFRAPGGLSPPRQRTSKAALRAELAQAEERVTRIVSCVCGHRGTVAIPSVWIGKKTLRCSKCGEVAE